ncbi:MAG TPA: DUF397 domain-containing protein [Actinophytocola sp.]|uniref:DUF397 domain-containing protein n=1 Tax=Actinophytocola sp. TaxID=1872138 RepID=UPI002DB75298|nr:DUF397 domain-containing protein [Actinophytocola sp.]HEU5471342.1 DUF397 domain-containing protein [Actinophytocola sp.]
MSRFRQWRKSSYSNEDGACVEVVNSLDAVRDSKNPGGSKLTVDVRLFVRAVKDQYFDKYGRH